ncbi:discoidin domain-containing protein [Paenibacillus sp. Soil787]|uniref:discoidin domain-containing protein n=1 Tax=Paenibacillus sp. Soil787 TaxID=1736411 RepID=UPI0006F99B1E|nr:discoidin domain-containing protein [Paenibacillus sp. Soil787]KRF42980.1 hypothetical protein ASG93_20735 [Paenibacillus sp. Soil787]
MKYFNRKFMNLFMSIVLCFTVVCAGIGFSPKTTLAAGPYTINAGQLIMTLDDTGKVTNLKDESTNTDYASSTHLRSLIQLVVNGAQQLPTALSYDSSTSTLDFYFNPIDTHVFVKVETKGNYATFEVTSITTNVDIEILFWGPIATSITQNYGEYVGAVYNSNFAIGIKQLNNKTIGGWVKEYENLSYNDGTGEFGPAFAFYSAYLNAWGGILQSYTYNHSVPRTRGAGEPWSPPLWIPNQPMPALPGTDGQLVGSKIALYGTAFSTGTAKSSILNSIASIETGEGLPHPMLDGQWAKTSQAASQSFLVLSDLNTNNVALASQFANQAGLNYIYSLTGINGPWTKWGHFQFNSSFGGSDAAVKTMVDTAATYGVKIGVHTLSNLINNSGDSYTTPIPNPDLVKSGSATLTQSLGTTGSDVYVSSNTPFLNGQGKSLQIGNEIMTFSTITQNSPTEWKLSGVSRANWGTAAASHTSGDTVHRLVNGAYGSLVGGISIIKEMSTRLATIFNTTGIKAMSWDGLETASQAGYGYYPTALLVNGMHSQLNSNEMITEASNGNPNTWSNQTRLSWGEQGTMDFIYGRNAVYQRNLLPQMMGWLGVSSLIDTEYKLSKAASWNAGTGFQTSVGALNGMNSTTRAAILDAIKQWETARNIGAFTQDQKDKMRDKSTYWHLSVVTPGTKWSLQQTTSAGVNIGAPEDVYQGNTTVFKPIAVWKLDEASGTSAADSSGNANLGIVNGTAAWAAGKINNGLSLNGTDAYIAASNLVSTQQDNITMSAWVKWNGATANSQFIVYNGNTATNGYGIYLDHTNGDTLSIMAGGKTNLSSQVVLPVGQWTQVTALRRNGTWMLYVNGSSVFITNRLTTPNVPSGVTTIGAAHNGMQFFKGMVDEVRFYNRALSDNEVRELYPIPQSQMTAAATSQETVNGNQSAANVLDGSSSTIWQTKGDLSNPLPQSITLNLGGSYIIDQLRYVPRQDGSPNGNITAYKVYTSTDGLRFTLVGTGTWANDATEKIATFKLTTASYVRLEATAGTGEWAAASEINVVSKIPMIPQSQMTATAISQQTDSKAANATDGDMSTIWNTELDLSNPLSQSITLNLGGSYNVNQLSYMPRQDGSSNGNITAYKVYTSTDGISFTQVSTGTWSDDATEKIAKFTPTTAKHIRLEAIAGTGGWSAASEINVVYKLPTLIPQSQMSATATSQETVKANNQASFALDGDASTMWHIQWDKVNQFPFSITLNLGGSYNVNQLNYLPRQDHTNGIITAYNVYASTNGTTFTKVATGTWSLDTTEKIVEFAPTTAAYIRLEATAGGGGYAAAAEINVGYPTVDNSNILQSITAPASINGVANGTAKTAIALGLPTTVKLITDTAGSLNASVVWDVNASSYNPSLQAGQTFTVNGTITLPDGVANPNNVALTTNISVTVMYKLPTLPTLIPQSQMSATATSQETVKANNIAANALDGNVSTIWHMQWDKINQFPQSITLNLGGSYNVSLLKYIPRQDHTNGDITAYNVYTSTNGTTFTKVATGTWSVNTTEKTVEFAPTTATYIRLEATAGSGGWAAAAEINVGYKTVDNTPPVTTDNATAEAVNQDVIVTLNAVDSYSGVAATNFTLDGGAMQSGNTVAINTEGVHTLVYWSVDYAGNVEQAHTVTVSIDKTAPIDALLSADITAPTNRDVIVTISYPSDATVKEYKVDNGVWTAYGAPVVVSENSTVYARGTDAAGNVSNVKSYTVSNIDHIAPFGATLAVDTTAPTNQGVTVTINYPVDASLMEYKVGASGDWIAYTASVVVSDNETVFARGIDAVGNVSNITSITVSNIYKIAPVTTATLSPAAPNGKNSWYTTDVTISLSVSASVYGGSVTTEYQVNDSKWVVYTGSIPTFGDGTYKFGYRSKDEAGNVEQLKTVEFKVDKTVPTLSVQLDKTSIWPVNHKMVTINATLDSTDVTSDVESVVLTSITSNQPDSGKGDIEADFGSGATSFSLRAEKSRIYTITYTATDKAGNKTVESVTVAVPHDQSDNQ